MSYGALGSLPLPLTFAAGALGLLLGPWLPRLPRLAITFLLFSLIFGQSLRFPLPGQGGGLLVSDLAVIIVLLSAGLKLIGHWILLTPFILWSLFTLIIHVPELGPQSSAIAFAYWARLTSHLLLLPALLILFQDTKVATIARRGLLLTATLLVLLGFLQLLLIPDFTALTKLGWDPHQNRLTSTWLDPNFFGAFLAIILPFVIVSATGGAAERLPGRGALSTQCDCGRRPGKEPPRQDPSPLILLIVLMIIAALVLTQSRSAFIALTLSVLLLSPLIIVGALRRASPPRIIATISFLLLVLIITSGAAFLLHDRLAGLVTLDATTRLRLAALKEVWQLAQQHAWLGVGYNAYQFAAAKSGLISNFTIHSRASADNSLLTLWVTTGIIGLVLFFTPWALISQGLFRRWLSNNNPYALAALVSFITLLIHSQFVNSLLYSHLLITLIVIVALAFSDHSIRHVEQAGDAAGPAAIGF